MIPATFEYTKATSVEAAIAALADGDAKILAGGHSLLPAMKLRLNMAGKLVDISKLEALKGISIDGNEIVIGAAATHADIASNEIIKQHLPLFADGAHHIGDVQVRNHGTIGGSLAHADPAADWPALVLAADAAIEVQGVNGKRNIAVSDFFLGLFETALAEDEIITSIRVPIPPAGSKSTYHKFVQPASRFAIVGCAVMMPPSGGIRIAFTGVSDTPFRDAAAEVAYNKVGISDACNAAAEKVTIMSDHFASENYRKHIAKLYLRKALEAIG